MLDDLRTFWRLITEALRVTLRDPVSLVPAALLLAPTLLLQIVFVDHLRSRLAPALWTVAVGALLIAWWQQVASMAAIGVVHARRVGRPRPPGAAIVRVAVLSGTLVTAGLLVGGLPGLWLQARWALAPTVAGPGCRTAQALRESTLASKGRLAILLGIVTLGLVAGIVLQGAVAALAEGLGTITAAGTTPDGRTRFVLATTPHVATSIVAWLLTAWVVSTQAVAVCLAGLERPAAPATITRTSSRHRLAADDTRFTAGALPSPPAWGRGLVRLAAATAAVVLVLAFAYKVHQHL